MWPCRAIATGTEVQSPVGPGPRQKYKNVSLVNIHHLRAEQDWLVRCQYKASEWGIMLIYGMVLRCAGILLNPACVWTCTADLTPHCCIYVKPKHIKMICKIIK